MLLKASSRWAHESVHRDEEITQTNLRLIPLIETSLNFLGSLFGYQGAVHHASTHTPELILEVGFAAREDLVGVTDRGFALLTPAQELVRQRIIERHLGVAQREEARQGIGIEGSEFIGGDPAQERLRFLGMRGSRIH